MGELDAALRKAHERTLALIKPDAYAAGHTGAIVTMIQDAGFGIVSSSRVHLRPEQAAKFYSVHRERPFFAELTEFISSGHLICLVLQREDAINKWRELMGPTDITQAPEETIRARFATSMMRNAVHGSDSPVAAVVEIDFWRYGSHWTREQVDGRLWAGLPQTTVKAAIPVDVRQLIEAAREHARRSRDEMLPALEAMPLSEPQKRALIEQRMNIVMDCYLTGCAEMLKRLHGDDEPESWTAEYDHEARLRELFATYE